MLVSAAFAQAAKSVKPSGPSINGAVYTTVDGNTNYTGQCKNGNPLINCNIYFAKKFVFLNGGPSNNHLRGPVSSRSRR